MNQNTTKRLALFDFDGTLSPFDSLWLFLKFERSAFDFWFKMATGIWPFVFAKIGLFSKDQAKLYLFNRFFSGYSKTEFEALGQRFFANKLQYVCFQQGIEQLKQYQLQGYEVAIVSASLSVYLKHLAQALKVDLHCTELGFEAEKYTGKYIGENCNRTEKARRIKAAYTLSAYAEILAFGDSDGDKAMFALATRSALKPFTGRLTVTGL